MKAKEFNIFVFMMASVAMMSCEDKINPELESAEPVYVVDAWLTNKPGPQVILLSKTQPYFENTLPPGVSGAIISVKDDKGNTFNFLEDDKVAGKYVWTPTGSEVFGVIGNKYDLNVLVGVENISATSTMGRVPPVDSVTFDTDKRTGSNELVTRGQFWATDPAGHGDAYWIRTYKNGVLLNKPSEINIAFDAGFTSGGNSDGVTFITPIRRRINSNDKDADGKQLSPIVTGDSLNVQIYSITSDAFEHLNQLSIQTNRPGGFSELFARPLANVSTNLVNSNTNGTKAQGFFNVSAVSTGGKRYKP